MAITCRASRHPSPCTLCQSDQEVSFFLGHLCTSSSSYCYLSFFPLLASSPTLLLSLSLFYSFTLLLSCPCLLHLTETGWLHRCTMDAITLISLNKQFSSHLTKVTRVTLNFNFIHTIKNRLWQMRSHSKKKNFFNW